MKHRNIDSIERGINLIRKLKGIPRRTKLNRNSWDYRHEGAEVVELSIICDLWNLDRRCSDDTAEKMNARDDTQLTGMDLEDNGFVPDFTEAAYKIAFELDRGYFVSLRDNSYRLFDIATKTGVSDEWYCPTIIDNIFQEWEWIDEVMDKAREYPRAVDYSPVDGKEAYLLENFKPNQTKAAKAEVIVTANFPGMTPDLARKIVKNSLI